MKKSFGLGLSLLIAAAMLNGCVASNSGNNSAGTVENIDQYDTVFFGFPNWYYDMPQIMYSFLDISRNVVQDSEQDIIEWLTDKGLIQ